MSFRNQTARNIIVACWALVIVISVLDYATGYEIGIFAFYFIPVGLGAWEGGRPTGLALALVSALAWLFVDIVTGHPYSHEWYRYWNAILRGTAFVVLALLVANMRRLVEKDREQTAKEMNELRGLLPICASCKNIRNDKGYWEHIESYISARSDAEFTHGICPVCAQKLYPEFVKPHMIEKLPPKS